MLLRYLQCLITWLQACLYLLCLHQTAAQTHPGTATCQAIVTLSTNWVQASNNATFASVNLNIVNKLPTAVAVPWTLTLTNAGYGMVRQVPNSSNRMQAARTHLRIIVMTSCAGGDHAWQ